MKITLFIPSLDGGGAERVVVLLANELSLRGYDVDLMLVQQKGPHLDSLSDRVKIVSLDRNGVLDSLFMIRRYIKKVRPAYFISHLDHANLITVLAKLLLPASNTRFFLTEHITPSEWFKSTISFKDKIVYILGKLFYRFADRIIAVSKGVADDVACFYHVSKDKISVIYNPVIGTNLFEKATETSVPLFETQMPYILGMGRLVEQKNFPVLLKAFKMLSVRSNCGLLILGEGPLRKDLEGMIKEQGLARSVKLPGYIPNPYPYLKQAKVFVLSSRREALPTVLIEAMALGVPVVSTDCPCGPREILDKGKLGRLVPVDDAQALMQAIEATILSPLPSHAKETERYTVAFAADEYMRLLPLR